MISVIICHRNKEYLNKISDNIKNTIGTDYELIIIDNTTNQYSIFEAYNIGVSKSNNEIICFSHEDIIFHTNDWGINVLNHFKNSEIGIIGICGGNSMPICPAPWWNSEILNDHLANNINTWEDKPSWHNFKNPYNQNATEALLIDGAWFCTRKSYFTEIRFDNINFKGFHCYDSDICLQVKQIHKKIVVVYDILLEHFSAGVINNDWCISAEILADKWSNITPIFVKNVDSRKIGIYNYECLLTYCYWLQSLKLPDEEIRKKIKKYLFRILPINYLYHSFILLYLWYLIGYKTTRYLYYPVNFIKKIK